MSDFGDANEIFATCINCQAKNHVIETFIDDFEKWKKKEVSNEAMYSSFIALKREIQN